MDRFAEPFARAMAVFVAELSATGALRDDSGVAPCKRAPSQEQLMHQLAETIAEQERLAKRGEIESITVDDNAITKAVAARIRWVMHERGVSQADVSDRVGVSPAVISRILKNPGRSRVDTIRKIAKALDVELRDIL
jgi:DNA-binding Xre family transcriptional regulator